MNSFRKYIVELEGRAVYTAKSYDNEREVAWRLIKHNKYCEVIMHINGIICGI